MPVNIIAAGWISGAGSIDASGTSFGSYTPARTGTGTYTITFTSSTLLGTICQVTARTPSGNKANATKVTDSPLQWSITIFNNAGSAADGDFFFEIKQLD